MEGKLILIADKQLMVVTREPIVKNDWALMFDEYGNLFLGSEPQQYKGEEHVLVIYWIQTASNYYSNMRKIIIDNCLH